MIRCASSLAPTLQGSSLARSFQDEAPQVVTHIFTVDIGFAGASKELPPQQVPVILQEGQVEVAEKLHVFVLHPKLLGGIPVNDLEGQERAVSRDHTKWA